MTSQAASMGARAVGERPFPDRPEGTDTLPQIDHILVLMMENHTYDNWLGMLGRGPGQQPRGRPHDRARWPAHCGQSHPRR